MRNPRPDTRSASYTARLDAAADVWWKRWLGVQAPYRWNLRRLQPGTTLDIGCGVGRNLLHLDRTGVGIDHNPHSVEVARKRGCVAYTPEAFRLSPHAKAGSFDSLLLAHVLEHMQPDQATCLVGEYLSFLRPGGRVLLMTPQEAGFRCDESHVHFFAFDGMVELVSRLGLVVERSFSFPFPRFAGRYFAYNEFVVVARKP